MSKRDEKKTSLMKPADAMSAFAHHIPGVVAAGFTGLEKGSPLDAEVIPNPINSDHAAEERAVPPVASEERNMEICAWCGFMMHYGRGPISHGICPSCREMFFPEVPNA